MLKNYKELKVWQKSYKLCLEIYTITAKFPKEEIYGLTSQIRRSVVSIPYFSCKHPLLQFVKNSDTTFITSTGNVS